MHTALALLRLALHTPPGTPGPLALDLRPGDSLRADAHPGLAADAVLCQPPYNERDWGHDELQYDSRWPGGLVPPRGESELAWVLHCLAHTRPGGLAALLLPPTVASRRAGRRIRAELVRSGALRAVVALPAGTAPPYGVPLHLWLLRGPRPGDDFRRVLLLDAAAAHPAAEGGRDRVDWPALHRTVLDTWRAFDAAARTGAPLPADRPGVHSAAPALDLLDDETDLSPARHLPAAAPDGGAAALHHLQARLAELLASPADPAAALPAVSDTPSPAAAPLVTVGELARAGALEVHSSGQGVLLPRPATARPASPSSPTRTCSPAPPPPPPRHVRHPAHHPPRRRPRPRPRRRHRPGGAGRRPAGRRRPRAPPAPAAPRPGPARPGLPGGRAAGHRQRPPGQQLRLHHHPVGRPPGGAAEGPARAPARTRRGLPPDRRLRGRPRPGHRPRPQPRPGAHRRPGRRRSDGAVAPVRAGLTVRRAGRVRHGAERPCWVGRCDGTVCDTPSTPHRSAHVRPLYGQPAPSAAARSACSTGSSSAWCRC
ncbi:N-6 DNA methylase [Kitasatospora arboriphila]